MPNAARAPSRVVAAVQPAQELAGAVDELPPLGVELVERGVSRTRTSDRAIGDDPKHDRMDEQHLQPGHATVQMPSGAILHEEQHQPRPDPGAGAITADQPDDLSTGVDGLGQDRGRFEVRHGAVQGCGQCTTSGELSFFRLVGYMLLALLQMSTTQVVTPQDAH